MEEGVAEGGGGGQLPPLVILVSVTESAKLDKTTSVEMLCGFESLGGWVQVAWKPASHLCPQLNRCLGGFYYEQVLSWVL